MRSRWNSLVELDRNVSVFTSWEWQTSWWKHYAGNSRLRLLTVHKADQLVGALPLYVRRSEVVPLFGAQELRLVGSGGDTSPDYLGPVIAAGFEESVARSFVDWLVEHCDEWDALNLSDMLPTPFLNQLQQRLRSRALHAELRPCSQIQVARLPDSFSDYMRAMPGQRRQRLNRIRRRLVEQLGMTFKTSRKSDEIWSTVDALIELHRKRWADKDPNKGAFRSSRYLNFHREVIERCLQNDWIRLYRLEDAHGKATAVFYCYRYRDEVLYFQSGFDPALHKYSPGLALMGFAIESAIGEGARLFDMLKGEHAYKGAWTNEIRSTFSLIAHGRSARGRMSLMRHRMRSWKESVSRLREPRAAE